MCRLFAMTSTTPVSPMRAVEALNVMKEGHDGSGVGLFLSGLGGPFEDVPDHPILTGIFTDAGLVRLDEFMAAKGFKEKRTVRLEVPGTPPEGTPKRDHYLIRAYTPPKGWELLAQEDRELALLGMRLDLRAMGEESGDLIAFSFWPNAVLIKELGDPMAVGQYLGIEKAGITARRIMAQGRQNTNYAINLYACHPFFIQGVASMTNGENTAFVPIREFLESRGVLGYRGYQSDSEVFTHILHFMTKKLGLGLEFYKHVITPLADGELADHPDGKMLAHIKNICRKLIIDGPNCVIGCLADETMFMVQDRKKLRPGVVGGKPGLYAFSSEICGLDAAIPDRDKSADFQPMHLDTAIIGPECREVRICRQDEPLPRPR
ncbi:MAG: glutamate synthase [Desulfovibrionaceae bacterium]